MIYFLWTGLPLIDPSAIKILAIDIESQIGLKIIDFDVNKEKRFGPAVEKLLKFNIYYWFLSSGVPQMSPTEGKVMEIDIVCQNKLHTIINNEF